MVLVDNILSDPVVYLWSII